jgi:hypothetical protein
MKNRYLHALRGKKEFNTDIITEDDEDWFHKYRDYIYLQIWFSNFYFILLLK